MASKQLDPFFIVGTQRSGTTLLGRMLSAHPRLFVINEIGGIQKLLASSQDSTEAFKKIDEKFYSKKRVHIQEILTTQQKGRWSLKDPSLTYCLDDLKRLFPHSKIIFIVRDGRAVANSYLQVKWGVANIYAAAERWKKEIEMQQTFRKSHDDTCWLLKYEELLANPENVLHALATFLGEDYSPLMLTYTKQTNSIIKPKSSNENAFRKIDRRMEAKWKKELSEFQIGVFESIAKQQLQDFGYELVTKGVKVSPLLKLWWKGHQKVIGEVQTQYQWRVKPFLSQFTS